jgi:transposase
MSTERLSMQKAREILRHKLGLGLSHRDTATSVGVSVGVVSKVLNRAEKAGIDWAAASTLDDDVLDVKLYGPRLPATATRPPPNCVWIHVERKKPGVTLELLHIEYLEDHPDGYRYSQFCDIYRRWAKQQKLSMRQVHVAGERLFVDYSGKKPKITDPKTGEVTEVELFVAVLGASNFTYAEATRTQRGVDFIQSHVRSYEFIGGVPSLTVPDQLKSGVTTSCWYDPAIQRTYEEMAQHYGTAVLPARPKRPRDKAKVEVAVQIVQRWILARIRNEVFFSLDALNERIAILVDELNARPMKMYGGKSRAELFAETDKDALRPLPGERFTFAEWKDARVNIDYHVEVDKHWYSVPYTLLHEVVNVRLTSTTVEVFHKHRRVDSHLRSYVPGKHTTKKEHMPKAHQEALEWPPSRLIDWAAKFGPNAQRLVTEILDERPHPEQGYRACLGILRLGKRYGDDRLDGACARALLAGARNYRHVESILKHSLDKVPLPEATAENTPVKHENVRGPGYYH